MATLAHGLPSLLLPLGADQPHNAARAEELGVAVTLDPATVEPDEVEARARALLGDRSMHDRCAEMADEVRAVPGASAAVAALLDAAR